MRLEYLPMIIGVLVGLLGLGMIVDAWTPDDVFVKRDRRRSPRIERNRGGEAAIGVGIVCMAGAFIGGDTWVYSVIAVIVGTLALVYGTWRNRAYLRALISNRGSLRRRDPADVPQETEPAQRLRIR